VVGEALIDEYPDARIVAGAPLHVAAHLATRGWRARLVSRVGDDADGRRILSACDALGIDTSLVEVDRSLPTGTTAIALGPGGHRFEVRFPAAWDAVAGPDPVPPHDALVFGSLALRHPTAAATVRRLAEVSTGLIVVDANLRPPHIDLDELAWAVGVADLLKMNADEAGIIGERPDGPEWTCLTLGANGAELRHRDGRSWSAAGLITAVVDTVGAGDAFLAVMIDGLVTGDDPGEALAEANRVAAEIVGRRGGLPD
jgi:fructokinase